HLHQLDVLTSGEVGEEHRGGVVAGAQESQPDGRPGTSGGGTAGARGDPGRERPDRRVPLGTLRILEEEADPWQLTTLQPCVDLDGVVDGKHPRHQALKVDLRSGHEVEEAGHVAPLGPADIPGRVVHTVELVAGVVPPGTVGTGEAEVQLLLVELVPGEVEATLPDVDDAGSVAR